MRGRGGAVGDQLGFIVRLIGWNSSSGRNLSRQFMLSRGVKCVSNLGTAHARCRRYLPIAFANSASAEGRF